jgi:hypothetical protein
MPLVPIDHISSQLTIRKLVVNKKFWPKHEGGPVNYFDTGNNFSWEPTFNLACIHIDFTPLEKILY